MLQNLSGLSVEWVLEESWGGSSRAGIVPAPGIRGTGQVLLGFSQTSYSSSSQAGEG